MIRSMTAFARQTQENEIGTLTWELKSVNHRFSEVSLRLPEEFRPLEAKFRARIGEIAQRGKVDANLRYQAPALKQTDVQIDQDLLRSLSEASRQVSQILEQAGPVNPLDILKWPGVMKMPELDQEMMSRTVMSLLDSALQELSDTRLREGEKLKNMLLERCDAMEKEVALVKTRLPEALQAMKIRLAEKLQELKGELDENRLEQEMLLFANKCDVAEEMDRLQAHLEEVRRVLEQKKPVGRRLDFLMQELNREANTLASKSVDTQLTRSAVELKVLIEQMREQVQNIE